MGSRLRALGVGLVVAMGALVLASPAWAGGTWMYASSNHTQLQINFQTDNSQSAFFEVFTLSVPVVSATCPGGVAGSVGQPDNNPDEFECQLSPAASGVVTVTTASSPLELCSANIANEASFDNTTYTPQNPIMPISGNCPPPKPVNTGLPQITGDAQNGQTLTASPGTWTNDPTSFAYQWEDCHTDGNGCSAITRVESTGSSYGLNEDDVGHTLRVVVTATNAGGSVSATSDPTAVVQEQQGTLMVGTPSMSGSAVTLPVECSSQGAQVNPACVLFLVLTVLGGGQPSTGPAADLAKAASCQPHRKHCPKPLVVGATKVKIPAGHTKNVRITLDRAGRRLLAKAHKLKVKLTITESGHVLYTRTIVFKTKPAKKHR